MCRRTRDRISALLLDWALLLRGVPDHTVQLWWPESSGCREARSGVWHCLRMSSRTPGTRQCVTVAQVRVRSPAHMCGAAAPIGEHRAARLIRLQK
ncbi:hypothetical protein C8Q73DRAFT_687497 [Cubamyces lactineus]|nr:hypothetical protein C8Q73DRAFT_687497 [Cubamyces lactineus]